ncbi:amidohydrolase family protein [Desulfurivibrio alkaliphilus]|uniref:Amidohydrolase n=1 Tax=Desulfurivibrio alkaliphilus (strain DSM 19089 / UNIQEM U267 / AHT2) TaxID=589865 RepID=D6Z059_DESAT|nr:amidohydrolase family protein [Desulfurivibrio alkaliphilus]ADH87092.1 amidohydrolase [Desulfurivibrio alkaliphilus AHT 2]
MNADHIIMAGNLLDGSGAGVRRRVFLAMQAGCITAIGPVAELPRLPPGVAVTDLSHATLLPALVDGSVALARSSSLGPAAPPGLADTTPEARIALLQRHLGFCLSHGVLGAADGEDATGLVADYQQRMAPSGPIALRTAPHDFLRIGYSANIEADAAPDNRLSAGDLYRLLQHRGDKKAVVVANGRQAVAEALAAGCDAIEQGYAMGEDNLKQMAARGVLWLPALLRAKNALDGARGGGNICCRFSQRYVAPGKPVPGAEALWRQTLSEQLALLQRAKELGVTTAVGTGAGSAGIIHGEAVAEEVKLFIKAGYSLAEAIRCASVNGAAFFGFERLGELAVGRQATFLVTRGTAGQLPRKLSYLEGIYIDGVAVPL